MLIGIVIIKGEDGKIKVAYCGEDSATATKIYREFKTEGNKVFLYTQVAPSLSKSIRKAKPAVVEPTKTTIKKGL